MAPYSEKKETSYKTVLGTSGGNFNMKWTPGNIMELGVTAAQ